MLMCFWLARSDSLQLHTYADAVQDVSEARTVADMLALLKPLATKEISGDT